jgi:outer membrane receptor protein involved in Fe transport
MRRRSGLVLVLAFGISFGCATAAFAQVSASLAQLNGTITDASGGVVAKAPISLHEMDTNLAYAAASNDSGFYVVPNLPPGRYELKVSYAGFANYTQKEIVLSVGQTATINVTLRVASQGEQVVVSSEAPTIEPTKTEISQVIDTKQIGSLPVSGRLFTDFALLTPGVATGRTSLGTTFTEFEITQISFGGMRSFSNMITVDGADFVNANTGVQRSTPPQESVQEFRVVNNSFGAEYGRAMGGIVNVVTKSGTNELHGSVYDYLQNDAVDARSLIQPAPSAHTLRQNQFGGTLGGPIRKDKTFFFLNYEGQRRAESPTYPPDLVADLATINLAKTTMGLLPENLNILKTKDNDYGFARLDHQLTANNRLTARYNVEDARDLNQLVGSTVDGFGLGTPSAGRNLFVRDQSLVGTLTSSLKPNLINTALVQYARRHYNFPGATGQPDLSVVGDLEFGHNFGTLDAIYESRVQFSDSLAWVKGNHLAKFGFDTNYLRDFVIWPGFTPERIIIPGLNCVVDFANFVNPNPSAATHVPSIPTAGPCPVATIAPPFFGFPPPGTIGPNPNDGLNGVPALFYGVGVGPGAPAANGSLPVLSSFSSPQSPNWPNAFRPDQKQNFYYNLNHSYYGFFAQDQWRLTSKLTFNYGLRYDFETGLGRVYNSDYRGFQPRVGFAWAPDSKTVIRAGFGIFDDRYNLTFVFIQGPQRTVQLPGVTYPTRKGSDTATWVLNFQGVGLGPVLNPPPGPPITFPAVVAKQILTTSVYPPQFITGGCSFAPADRNCTAGGGGLQRDARIPYSEQASLEIDRQIGKGLTLNVGYLFVSAHKLIRGNNLNVSCPVGTSKPNNPAFAQGLLNPDGTTSACTGTPVLVDGKPYFSHTGAIVPAQSTGSEFNNPGLLDFNNNVVNTNYHGLTIQALERLGKHFNLTASYTFSKTIDDGTFTTFVSLPQNQFDYNAERGLSNQDVRHRFVANFTAEAPKSTFLRNFAISSVVTLQSGRPFTEFVGFDANNDTNPVTDRVGTIGRNTYTGDGLYAVDLRVSRYFQLGERMKLDLSVDAFNLFNRPNPDEIFTIYGVPTFCGAIPTRYKDAASLAIQQRTVACAPPPLGSPEPFVPAPNSFFGAPRTTLNPRQLQFAAKFSF